jgi:hypothetical protein
MIANRAKIEKQIYLGRQYVRNKSKAIATSADNTRFLNSNTPPPSGSDRPLSVDTDAETAFTSSRSFFRNKRTHISPSNSGTTTPRDHHSRHQDPLRSPAARRRWASSLLSTGENSQTQPTPPPVGGSESFFTRLRTKSLSTLVPASPTLKEMPVETAEDAWSSDSSSEDDLIDLLDRRNSSVSVQE